MPRVAEPSAPKYSAAVSAPDPGVAEVVGMIRQARAAAQLAAHIVREHSDLRSSKRKLQRQFDTQLAESTVMASGDDEGGDT